VIASVEKEQEHRNAVLKGVCEASCREGVPSTTDSENKLLEAKCVLY